MKETRVILQRRNAQAARNDIRTKTIENFIPVPFPVFPIDFSDPEERWAAKILMGMSKSAEVIEITVRLPPAGGSKGDETDIEDVDPSDTTPSSTSCSLSLLTNRQIRSTKSTDKNLTIRRKRGESASSLTTQAHPAKKVRPSANATNGESSKNARTTTKTLAKKTSEQRHPLALLKLKVRYNDSTEDNGNNNEDENEENLSGCIAKF